jgi:GNAT superfamily N-acetyltransferase
VDSQLIADATYFIAYPVDDPEAIAGCGGWSYRKTLFGSDHGPGREPETLDPAVDAAKIRAIFIHPTWARQGVGSLILKQCEDAAVEAGFRRFEMGSTLTGMGLYRLKGYEERKRVDVALPNGERLPIVHMVKVAGQGES